MLWILPTFTPSTITTSLFSLGQSLSAPRTVRGSRFTKYKSYTPRPNFLLISNTPLFTNCTSNLCRSQKVPRTVRGTFSPFLFPSQFFYVFSWIHPLRDHHLNVIHVIWHSSTVFHNSPFLQFLLFLDWLVTQLST